MSFDQVFAGLYQGSAPERGTDLPSLGFGVLVLCAREYQPPHWLFGDVAVIRAPMDDAPFHSHRQNALPALAAHEVVKALKRERQVLVTCGMGLNRSGLVSALALLRLGFGREQAIAMVRRARGPQALSNPWFVRYIRTPPSMLVDDALLQMVRTREARR